jgi:hypothetical protein
VETKVLDCGCTIEEVNGKMVTILCEDHEEEYQDMLATPVHFKKTKMRTTREN